MTGGTRLLEPHEIAWARRCLGLSTRELALGLMMSEKNGPGRVEDWESGRIPITGPASQAIRFWLALRREADTPLLPDRRRRR